MRQEQVDILCKELQRIVDAAYAMRSILHVHGSTYGRNQYVQKVEELSAATDSFMTIWREYGKSLPLKCLNGVSTFSNQNE